MYVYNEAVKTLAKVLALIYVLIGLGFVGYGLYVVFLPWGSVDKETYLAIGIILTLFGSSLTCVSLFGYLAAEHQLKRYGKGWTGRSALTLYMLYLICFLGAVILGYIYGHKLLDDTSDKIDLLTVNPAANPEYSTVERSIRDNFNILFFYSSSHCSGKYRWFWNYIRDHCPEGIHWDDCKRCESYSVSLCGAYEPLCYADDGSVEKRNNIACPYYACRRETLQYVLHTSNTCFDYILYGLGGTTVLQILCCILLICHRQTRKMVITVIDAPADGADADIDAQLQLGGGHNRSPQGSEKRSNKSEELNYHVYQFNDNVEMPQQGTFAAPPGSSSARYSGAAGTRRDTENAVIDSYIQMTLQQSRTTAAPPGGAGGSAGGAGAHAPLGATHHKPTAYSTYQLNMEIALAESLEADAVTRAAAGEPGGRSAKVGATGAAQADRQRLGSEEELALALVASTI